jgi:hypothetical protein
LPSLRVILWWISIVAETLLLAKLFWSRLSHVYRWFTVYILTDIACSLGMTFLTPDPHTEAYAWTWVSTEPLLLLLQLAFTIELYRRISDHYTNFDQIRPRLLWTCLGTAVIVSAVSLAFDLRRIVWTSPVLQGVFVGKRMVTFALAGFATATWIFVRVFPIPIRPNIKVHWRMATIYFLANAVNYFAIDVRLMSTNAAGIALMIITTGCFLAWTALLNPLGEDVALPPAPSSGEIDAHLQRGEELLERVREVKRGRQ